MHRTTERFWKCFNELPKEIQRIAREQFNLFKSDPHYPSFHFKKGGKVWSIRVSLNYRALGIKDSNDFVWIWIGIHDEYEKMIKKLG